LVFPRPSKKDIGLGHIDDPTESAVIVQMILYKWHGAAPDISMIAPNLCFDQVIYIYHSTNIHVFIESSIS
jgi:hypothetical protein